MLNGSKVLVAGGTGFIGSNLISRLLSEGCQIRSSQHCRPLVIRSDDVEYVKADFTRMDDCQRAVDGMDYVFMCAANTSGAAVMTSTPLVHVTPNVIMNARLMEAAYTAKVKKCLFIGSSAAYPPTDERPVREDEMFLGDPYDTYYSVGWMKRYAEILCLMYARHLNPPMPMVVVRPSNAYGQYDDYEFGTSHMMAALIRRVAERQQPIEVWGNGEDIRDLIYIDDLIDGMIRVFKRVDSYAAVNIASGEGHTVKQVLQTIIDVDGYTDADVRFDPCKPATIPARLIDATKAEIEFGFRAKTSLKEGVRKTLDWYRRVNST